MSDLLIVIFCLAINAVFSAYEMSFVTITDQDVEGLDEKHLKIREALRTFKTKPERTLSVIQIGITLVGAVAAAVGGSGAVENVEPYLIANFHLSETTAKIISVIVIILPLTYFSVVFGELVPKTIALRYPEEVLNFGTRLIYLIDKILSPIVTFLEKSTNGILKLLGLEKDWEDEELPESVEIGNLPSYHRKFVYNLVGLKNTKVKSAMLPWSNVSFLNFSDTDDEVKEKIHETRRSRFPVIDGDVLVGMFYAKEWKETIRGNIVPWQTVIGNALSVNPDDLILDVFLNMQKNNHHMAVVVDKHEKICGIITIEDVLEQIVGNIRDDLERNKITRLLNTRTRMKVKSR